MTTDDVDATSGTPGDPHWARSVGGLQDAPVSSRVETLRRLADVTRRMVHGMALTQMDDDELTRAVDAVEAAATAFMPEHRSPYVGYGESSIAGDPRAFFEHSPLLGRSNPIAPPIHIGLLDDGETMEGRVTFGPRTRGRRGACTAGSSPLRSTRCSAPPSRCRARPG